MNFTITLNKIRAHSPCRDGWEKLLSHLGKTKADDEPLHILAVLDSNGAADAAWCVRGLESDAAVALAIELAEAVLPVFESRFPGDDRPRKAIEAARSGDAAYAATYAAWAAYAAADAARAADAAAEAAYAARAAGTAAEAAADAAWAAADAAEAAVYAADAAVYAAWAAWAAPEQAAENFRDAVAKLEGA